MTRNKLFSGMFIFILFVSLFAVHLEMAKAADFFADKYVLVSMVNQEPDPVEPGKYITVRFKIANYGRRDTGMITIGISPEFPFTVVGDGEYEKSIGVLQSRQLGDKSEIVEWKLLVDKDAPEGTNQIVIYYTDSLDSGTTVYRDSFSINVRRSDSFLDVVSIQTEPELVEPGQETTLLIKLKNTADSFVKDVRITLGLEDKDITTIGSTNQRAIQKINGNEEVEIRYQILPSSGIPIGIQNIPINIEFKDNLNNLYSRDALFGLKINSPIEYLIYLDETDITQINQKGDISMRVSNPGLDDIRFLTVELKNSPQYRILSAPQVYIGNVESDDYESVNYNIYTKESGDDGVITLRVLMTFRDNYNKKYTVENEVLLQLYSTDAARKYGLAPTPNYTWAVVLLLLVALGFWIYLRRKKKKKALAAEERTSKRKA
jgi:hypothetical protein